MAQVQAGMEAVFGAYAGWAHNALFVAELANHRQALPEALRTTPVKKKRKQGDGGGDSKPVGT